MSRKTNPRPSLDHVGLTVPDLDAAVAFFERHFGAEVVFHLPRFVDPTGAAVARLGAARGASFSLTMLELVGGYVELLEWEPQLTPSEQPDSAVAFPPNLTNGVHLALEVKDIGGILDELRQAPGVTVLSDPLTFREGPTPGLTNAFITTPWGLLIELMAWPEQNARQ